MVGSPSSHPSIWILRSTGVGADRQMLNLAEALGGEVRFIDVLDSPARAVLDRLKPGSAQHIPEAKRAKLSPPWPELVLFGGGRSLVDAERIRTASGGHAKIVCIGRIAARLDRVDLLLTTPQYSLPDHARVVHLDLPLNFVEPSALEAAAGKWRARFASLPRPWHGVMLGGPSGSFRFDGGTGRKLGRQLQSLVRRVGGSLLITTSPRTGADVIEALLAEIDAPNWCYRWQRDDPDNPLTGILALSDDLVVTADSASMLAEACSLGKPVAVFEPPLTWPARLFARPWLPRPLARLWRPLRARLVLAGLWVPARRMERIHQGLIERGRIVTVANLAQDEPTSACKDRNEDLHRAVSAVCRLMEADDRNSRNR